MRSAPAHPTTTKGDHAAAPALLARVAAGRLQERRSHDLAQPPLSTTSPVIAQTEGAVHDLAQPPLIAVHVPTITTWKDCHDLAQPPLS